LVTAAALPGDKVLDCPEVQFPEDFFSQLSTDLKLLAFFAVDFFLGPIALGVLLGIIILPLLE
jgi:hypothetical protein